MSHSPKPYACSSCTRASCFRGELDKMPAACPTRQEPDLSTNLSGYLNPQRQQEMLVADQLPFADDGTKRNRVEELVAFSLAHGFRRLGIAYCVTLLKEAQTLGKVLRKAGIETELVCCRVGAIDYDLIGLPKAHPERFAAICNPVAQAKLLAERKVDLVVQLGLCLGHDLILQAESGAPVTTLIVKDRALDHNPIAALRQAHYDDRSG